MLTSISRQPRGIVIINDIRIAWLDIEVNNNAYYQADSFRVRVPLQGQPSGIDRLWWAGQDMLEIEIYAGIPADVLHFGTSDLELLIAGKVDNLPHEMVSDVITLTGRDYTAELIDTKTSNKWPEHRASTIAKYLAGLHGLTTKYVVETKSKSGTMYAHDHAKLQMDMSQWDLLAWLAHAEGFQVYVQGKDLHFEPKPDSPPVYPMAWADATADTLKSFDGTSLTFERNLTLAKDVIVHVKSWNQKQKKPFIKTAKSKRNRDKTARGYRIGTPQEFTYSIPNLTPEKALQRAQAILMDITKHQVGMTAAGIPAVGPSVLTPQHVIQVSGTGAYDQDYMPVSITRKMSMQEGYTMDIVSKNHDVNSVIPIAAGSGK